MPENGSYAGPNARLLAAGAQSHEIDRGRFGNALSVSALTHAVAVLSVLFVASRLSGPDDTVATLLPEIPRLAWIAPGDGGGGSGNRATASTRQLERPGSDPVAMPVKSRSDSRTLEPAAPPEALEIPAVSMSDGVSELPGMITTLSSNPILQGDGPGTRGRAGCGRGPGNGPGDGSGSNSGRNGGPGDGYQPGNGVSTPRLIREVKPGYTSEAMRARIQG